MGLRYRDQLPGRHRLRLPTAARITTTARAVSLTATPDQQVQASSGWSGDPDCSDGSVTMDQARSCTASFDLLPPDTYSLTVAKTGTRDLEL